MADDHEHCCEQPFEKSEFRVLGKLRFHIFVCSDGKDFCGCEAAGGGALLAALRQELVRRRLMAQCKITLMQCRQQGVAGPVLVVHPDNLWYEGLPAERAAEFVERQILRGEPLTESLMRGGPAPVTAVPAHLATPG
jgi:NADH-quinone oxidoreductase subunit F/NAD(P)H dehydrogenase (quinone)/NADP-reducing hydrogenase subunit HndC